MTFKISSNRFGRIFKLNIRRNLWLTGINTAAVITSILLYLVFLLSFFAAEYQMGFFQSSNCFLDERRNLFTRMFNDNDYLVVCLLVLAMVNGAYLVSRYYDRKRMDFFFAQPVKRRNWFWLSFAEGMLHVAVPYFMLLIVMLPPLTRAGILDGKTLISMLYSYLFNMLFYANMFTLVLLAASVSGHIVYACLNSCLLFFYVPTITGFVSIVTNSDEKVPGKFLKLMNLSTPLPIMFRPVNREFIMHELGKRYHFITGKYDYHSIPIMVLVTLLACIAGAVAFQTRGADDPKTLYVHKKLKKFMKAFLLVHFTMVATFIPYTTQLNPSFSRRVVAFIVSLAIGLLGLETAMENDFFILFRNVRRQIPYVVICIVFFVASQFVFRF